MSLIIYKKEMNTYLTRKTRDVILMSNKKRKLRIEVYN